MTQFLIYIILQVIFEAEGRGQGPTGADNYATGGGGHILSLQFPCNGIKYSGGLQS